MVSAPQKFTKNGFLEERRKIIEINNTPFNLEEMETGANYPVTKETITKYKQLIADPITREVWERAVCKELGRLTQGYGEIGSIYHTKGTNTMRCLDLEGTKKVPCDRVITYAIIVVDCHA